MVALQRATLKPTSLKVNADITRFVGAVGKSNGGTVALTIRREDIKKRVLELVIPTEPLSATQSEALDLFRSYLKDKGVALVVNPLKF